MSTKCPFCGSINTIDSDYDANLGIKQYICTDCEKEFDDTDLAKHNKQ